VIFCHGGRMPLLYSSTWVLSSVVINSRVALLNTKAVLHQRSVTNNSICVNCDKFVETLHHALLTCPTLKPALDFVHIIIPDLKNLSPQSILDLEPWNPRNPQHAQIVIIISEFLQNSWLTRNKATFENSPRCPTSTKQLFLHRLRSRIKADHHRLPNDSFQSLWLGNRLNVTVSNGRVHTGF
jgi:hypothetical protein